MSRNVKWALGIFLALGFLGAVIQLFQPAKLPIDQRYSVKPSFEGMECETGTDEEAGLTLCQMETHANDPIYDGRSYRLLSFITNGEGEAIWMMGMFRNDEFEDAFAEFSDRYGAADDKLGDAGDRRGIWFLKNGVAVMRERGTKRGEGSAAVSFLCFQANDQRLEELQTCKEVFKPAAI